MRDVGVPVAFDLRIVADPDRSIPLDIALVARVWDEDQPVDNRHNLEDSLAGVLSQLMSSLPRHVTAERVEDAEEINPHRFGDRDEYQHVREQLHPI